MLKRCTDICNRIQIQSTRCTLSTNPSYKCWRAQTTNDRVDVLYLTNVKWEKRDKCHRHNWHMNESIEVSRHKTNEKTKKKKNTIRMLDANLVKWANVNSLYYANWTATMAKFIVDTPAHRHRGSANVSANAYELTSVRMWHCADIEHCQSICIQINKQLAWVRDSHNWRLL